MKITPQVPAMPGMTPLGLPADPTGEGTILPIAYESRSRRNHEWESEIEYCTYRPTLADAKVWEGEIKGCPKTLRSKFKSIFIQDLLGLSLTIDGDSYVGRKVRQVENAYESLLAQADRS
jgi:hypothetical protein